MEKIKKRKRKRKREKNTKSLPMVVSVAGLFPVPARTAREDTRFAEKNNPDP